MPKVSVGFEHRKADSRVHVLPETENLWGLGAKVAEDSGHGFWKVRNREPKR